MTNPFRKHASNLFATRDDVDSAVDYANTLINSLPSDYRAATMTAIMVLINTAAAEFDKVPPAAPAGPSPERLVLVELIRAEIENWASEELEGKMTDWAQSELDIDQNIENWADNNLDDKIQDAIGNMEATVSFR